MKNNINNYALSRDLEEIIKNGSEFKKGIVSGNSIEYREGNSFCSLTYYADESARDEDLKTIEELLAND